MEPTFPPWVAGVIIILLTFLVLWIVGKALEGLFWLRYNGPWPVRILLAPVCFLLWVIVALFAINAANDLRDWWQKGR